MMAIGLLASLVSIFLVKARAGETDALKLAQSIGLADWVQVDATKMEGVFKKVPDRDQFGAEIKEALIVELYSR